MSGIRPIVPLHYLIVIHLTAAVSAFAAAASSAITDADWKVMNPTFPPGCDG